MTDYNIANVKEEIRIPDLPGGIHTVEFVGGPEVYQVSDTQGRPQGQTAAQPFRVLTSDNVNVQLGQTYRVRITKIGVMHDGAQGDPTKSSGYRALQQQLSLIKSATNQVGKELSEDTLKGLQMQWLSGQFNGKRIMIVAKARSTKHLDPATGKPFPYTSYAYSPLV